MTYKEITASTNNVFVGVTAGRRIRALLLMAGIDAASAVVFDALTQVAPTVATLKALANDSKPMEFPGEQGLPLNTGLSVTLTGTAPKLYVYYD